MSRPLFRRLASETLENPTIGTMNYWNSYDWDWRPALKVPAFRSVVIMPWPQKPSSNVNLSKTPCEFVENPFHSSGKPASNVKRPRNTSENLSGLIALFCEGYWLWFVKSTEIVEKFYEGHWLWHYMIRQNSKSNARSKPSKSNVLLKVS